MNVKFFSPKIKSKSLQSTMFSNTPLQNSTQKPSFFGNSKPPLSGLMTGKPLGTMGTTGGSNLFKSSGNTTFFNTGGKTSTTTGTTGGSGLFSKKPGVMGGMGTSSNLFQSKPGTSTTGNMFQSKPLGGYGTGTNTIFQNKPIGGTGLFQSKPMGMGMGNQMNNLGNNNFGKNLYFKIKMTLILENILIFFLNQRK